MKGENEMKKWKKPELLIIDEKEIETHIETYARQRLYPWMVWAATKLCFCKILIF